MKRYRIMLAACGNPDHGENPYINVVKGNLVEPGFAFGNSIDEVVGIAQHYIEDNDLGAGNWKGGDIYLGNVLVGHMSYNGRVWADAKA